MNKNNNDILTIYQNYLHALQFKEEYGDIYGDTEEIIQLYEEELKKHNIKLVRKKK